MKLRLWGKKYKNHFAHIRMILSILKAVFRLCRSENADTLRDTQKLR